MEKQYIIGQQLKSKSTGRIFDVIHIDKDKKTGEIIYTCQFEPFAKFQKPILITNRDIKRDFEVLK
ncbi:MAG TPA: hypothetical protein VNW06_09675 [Cytophagaceae bacterium]|jgi:hypothetical protein|nr:hypothetical protein [Cytophagaceae bacterium]